MAQIRVVENKRTSQKVPRNLGEIFIGRGEESLPRLPVNIVRANFCTALTAVVHQLAFASAIAVVGKETALGCFVDVLRNRFWKINWR